jgi:hypothetical protein
MMNFDDLGLTIVRKRAPIGTELERPRMLVERAELPEVSPEANPEYRYYPVGKPRPATAMARYNRDKLALLERVKREVELAQRFPPGPQRRARIVSAQKVLKEEMATITQAYRVSKAQGMGAIEYDAKRYQPHVRAVGPWGPYRLTEDSTLDQSGREVKQVVKQHVAVRKAMIGQMQARVVEMRKQGVPADQIRLAVRQELKAALASDRQAVVQHVRDLQKAAPRAEYDVDSVMAPQEVTFNPDYQEAVRDDATGWPVMVPTKKYYQPLVEEAKMPRVDSSPWTRHSKMEIGDYDYQRGEPYPLDLIETDMEKQGLMSYEIYERGWPYPPDLLWAEIERAGEDFGSQGVNDWINEELMSKYQMNGVKGFGAFETIFLM